LRLAEPLEAFFLRWVRRRARRLGNHKGHQGHKEKRNHEAHKEGKRKNDVDAFLRGLSGLRGSHGGSQNVNLADSCITRGGRVGFEMPIAVPKFGLIWFPLASNRAVRSMSWNSI